LLAGQPLPQSAGEPSLPADSGTQDAITPGLPTPRRTRRIGIAAAVLAVIVLPAAWFIGTGPSATGAKAPTPAVVAQGRAITAPSMALAPPSTTDTPDPAEPLTPPAAGATAETEVAAPKPVAAPPVNAAPKARKPIVKAAAPAPAVVAPPVLANGTVHIAISPWGQVEVNGAPAGTTPPLTRLELPQGLHTITVRNEDFPPYTLRVQVDAERPVTVKHRFGS
jgi:eukaryotic-like serine/threonine-protein kinase